MLLHSRSDSLAVSSVFPLFTDLSAPEARLLSEPTMPLAPLETFARQVYLCSTAEGARSESVSSLSVLLRRRRCTDGRWTCHFRPPAISLPVVVFFLMSASCLGWSFQILVVCISMYFSYLLQLDLALRPSPIVAVPVCSSLSFPTRRPYRPRVKVPRDHYVSRQIPDSVLQERHLHSATSQFGVR